MKSCLPTLALTLVALLFTTAESVSAQGLGGQLPYTQANASGSRTWKNVFGWRVGEVTINAGTITSGCNSSFSGPATLTETLAIQSCSITSVSPGSLNCPASDACPQGGIGATLEVYYECCLVILELEPFCVSDSISLSTCP